MILISVKMYTLHIVKILRILYTLNGIWNDSRLSKFQIKAWIDTNIEIDSFYYLLTSNDIHIVIKWI